MITSETFYRAECDQPGCGRTLPSEDDDASHWPRESVIEQLAEERGEFDETWAVVGEQTFCPEHRPGNTPCTACEHGYLRTELPAPREPGSPRWDFASCPVCGGRGYIVPNHTNGSTS